MSRRTLFAVGALLCVAVLAALLAADLLRHRDGVRSGDREFARNPATAAWHTDGVLPFGPAGRILDSGTDLAFRRAAQSFEAVAAAPGTFDPGGSIAASRGEAEADLGGIARSGIGARTSAADNMLGILAFKDSKQSGPTAPAPVDQSVGDFQAAVRADPGNEVAKYNLELLLRQLVARGSRRGANGSSAGPSLGHRGAGGGLPGRGY